MAERILVASDGTAGSLGALRVARKLQERRSGADVEVVTVVEPAAPPELDLLTKEATRTLQEEAINERQQNIAEQLRTLGAEDDVPPAWPLEVRVGSPAAQVAEEAEETGASIIVLGLGRARPSDRFMGTGIPSRVAQLSPAAVLAVEPGRNDLPARVVVGVDFSRFARRIVRWIPSIVTEEAEIHLIHVVSLPDDSREEWVHHYIDKAGQLLGSLTEELAVRGLDRVTTRTLTGDAATALLGYARDRGIDLIATGTQGHAYAERHLLGTVASKLLRAAECAVLLVPSGTPRE